VLTEHDMPIAPSTYPKAPAKAGTDADSYQANTNLEEISDWLTKILVGVGLIQIARLGKSFAHALAPSFGGAADSGAVGLAVVIYFAVAGFLLGYIWTRLRLTSLLIDSLRKVASDAGSKAASNLLAEHSDKDAAALAMVDSQLSPGGATVDPKAFPAAVAGASPQARVQIFKQTRDLCMSAKRLNRPELYAKARSF